MEPTYIVPCDICGELREPGEYPNITHNNYAKHTIVTLCASCIEEIYTASQRINEQVDADHRSIIFGSNVTYRERT